MVKNLPANAGDARDMSLIPGSGRTLGGGNVTPLKWAGAWQAAVHRAQQLDVMEHMAKINLSALVL